MVYLSANGEVLGSFEEEAVPGLMTAGTITEAAYYWREGMSEWLPVADLLQFQAKRREAPWPAPAVQLKPAVVLPSAAGLGVRKPFMVWRSPAVAEATGAAPKRAVSQTHPVAAGPNVKKPLVMGRGPAVVGATGAARQNETVKIMTPETTKPVLVPQAGKSGVWAAPQLSPVPVGEPKPAAGLLGLKKLFAMWRGPAVVGAIGAAAKSADVPSKPAAASAPAAAPQNEAVKIINKATIKPVSVPQVGKPGVLGASQLSSVGVTKPSAAAPADKKSLVMGRGPAVTEATGSAPKRAVSQAHPVAAGPDVKKPLVMGRGPAVAGATGTARQNETGKIMTPATIKPVSVPQVGKPGVLGASQLSSVGVTKPSATAPADKKSLLMGRGPAVAGATGAAVKSAETPSKPAAMSAPAAPPQNETVQIMRPATFEPAAEARAQVKPEAGGAFVADGSGAPKKGRGWLARLAGVLVFAAAAGGGAWWWVANAEPPFIPGTVALAGDESGPVQIRVFRRAELVVPWRERLAAAEARGVELEGLLAEARALLNEKSLLRDEAASVYKVGQEYNMPDVAELRADRDAKQAEAEAAQAEVLKMEVEKGGLLTFEGLLESVPAPMGTIAAGEGGVFALPPQEEDVVVLATVTVESDGQRQQRAWLEVLEAPVDGEAVGPVRFAEINRLDLDEIRRFAASDVP